MKADTSPVRSRQQGATLIVALIFLVLLTLFAINAFNSSTTSARVTGNMQMRQEAAAAAQVAIEQVISSTAFAVNPGNIAATPIPVDIDNNGNADYTVAMSPQPGCYRVAPIKNNQLNPALAEDRNCMTSSLMRNSGIDMTEAGVSSDNSFCANSEWNVRAVVTDANTGTQVAVNQGVALRVLEADASSFCK